MKKNSDLIQREVAFGFLSLTNQKQVKRRTHRTKYISIGVVSIDFAKKGRRWKKFFLTFIISILNEMKRLGNFLIKRTYTFF